MSCEPIDLRAYKRLGIMCMNVIVDNVDNFCGQKVIHIMDILWKTVVHRKKSRKNKEWKAGKTEKEESYQQLINKLWITFEMCIRWEN